MSSSGYWRTFPRSNRNDGQTTFFLEDPKGNKSGGRKPGFVRWTLRDGEDSNNWRFDREPSDVSSWPGGPSSSRNSHPSAPATEGSWRSGHPEGSWRRGSVEKNSSVGGTSGDLLPKSDQTNPSAIAPGDSLAVGSTTVGRSSNDNDPGEWQRVTKRGRHGNPSGKRSGPPPSTMPPPSTEALPSTSNASQTSGQTGSRVGSQHGGGVHSRRRGRGRGK